MSPGRSRRSWGTTQAPWRSACSRWQSLGRCWSMEQLQQLLARAGAGSRRRCAELVKSGRVTVNRSPVLHPGLRVDPTRDQVRLDGRPIEPPSGSLHLVLHKPAGYLSSRSDPRGRRTVMALLDPDVARRVYPVGRLDRDAPGLLLLTA
ncbi:MAG: rRNA pseudouridine synthase, partial [Armatimonadetes bacterium]|nr:rRNA pseudouridine synthase [Armatimonadota bacterium]